MTSDELQTVCRSLNEAVTERAISAEISQHVGCAPGDAEPAEEANHRDGSSGETALPDDSSVRIEVPRDRDGSYEATLIRRHERCLPNFDDRIIAMYALGMTVREIQGLLTEQHGSEVFPDVVSTVTDELMAEVKASRNRPLEPPYPMVFLDALRVKIREDAVARNRAVYLALGVLPYGTRDVPGLRVEQTEGAKFWF